MATDTSTTSAPKRLSGFGLHALMALLSLGMIVPFVWMVLTSLKSLPELGNPGWMPASFQWHNYVDVFFVIPFLRFMANSFVVAGWVRCWLFS
jgi:multiple sugar transport system permease protein